MYRRDCCRLDSKHSHASAIIAVSTVLPRYWGRSTRDCCGYGDQACGTTAVMGLAFSGVWRACNFVKCTSMHYRLRCSPGCLCFIMFRLQLEQPSPSVSVSWIQTLCTISVSSVCVDCECELMYALRTLHWKVSVRLDWTVIWTFILQNGIL